MQAIPAQLTALAVTDTLKKASKPAAFTKIPWAPTEGAWSETLGWSPSSFSANPPTGTRSGFYWNTEEQSGDHAVGLKKTSGSLLTLERQFEVWCCSAMGEKASGYQLTVITSKLSDGKVRFVLRRFIEGEAKVLFETTEDLPFNENDSFYLARVDNELLVYYRSGEGTPTLLGGATDTTFTKGFCAFGGNGSNPRLVDFKVGSLTIAEEVERFRRFSGVAGNTIIASIGTCNRQDDVTEMALVRVPQKPAAFFTYQLIRLALKGGSSRGYGLGIVQGSSGDTAGKLACSWLETEEKQTTSQTPQKIFTYDNHWKLVVVRKEVGAKKADFGILDLYTGEWTWEEGNEGAASKAESMGAEGTVWFGSDNGSSLFKGDFAAAMIGAVKSRAEIEALAKVTPLIDLRPSASGLWFMNKATVGEKFEDETGNGANQTNTPTTGSVVSEAPPIPYYVPPTGYTRTLIGAVVKFVKRWTLWGGAVRRF